MSSTEYVINKKHAAFIGNCIQRFRNGDLGLFSKTEHPPTPYQGIYRIPRSTNVVIVTDAPYDPPGGHAVTVTIKNVKHLATKAN
jgi:hypothetical protein